MIINFLLDEKIVGFLKVKLHDSLTAKTFLQSLDLTNRISDTHNHSISRTKVEIINDFLRLKQLVNLINASSYDRKIDINLDTDFSLKKLFDLHEHFEHLGHRYRTKDESLSLIAYEEVIELGCEMNGLIHKLETSLYSGSWMQALFKKPNIGRIPLTTELISESVKDYKKDHLYVGYGETGKNMAHIFQMNEVDLLERQMVQPQRYILSEFFIPFEDMIMNYSEYLNWCKKNNAGEKGYDYENPIWYGKWEVGQIIEKSFKNLAEFPIYNKIGIVQ